MNNQMIQFFAASAYQWRHIDAAGRTGADRASALVMARAYESRLRALADSIMGVAP